MRRLGFALISLCAFAWTPILTQASAQTRDFYAGKILTILVNYDAGGPTDIEARVLARHLARHIPGNPTILIQNMGGAAGLIGTRYLGEIAPKDGLTLGYLTAATQRYVSEPENFKVDFRAYEFVALAPSGRVHFMRTDVKPGIHVAADLVKAQGLVVGGLGADAPKDMSMRLVLDMLGVPFTYVTGYNSSAQASLALERGEISYYADSPSGYNSKIEPMVTAGTMLPVFYDPGFDGVTFSVPKQMKDVPAQPFQEYYEAVKGAAPSGKLWEAYRSLLTVNGSMYRLLALPPGAPIAARDALRQAMLAMNDDADYIAEARATMGEAPEYVTSADLNDVVRKGMSITPELHKFMQDYVAAAPRK